MEVGEDICRALDIDILGGVGKKDKIRGGDRFRNMDTTITPFFEGFFVTHITIITY